MAADGGRLDYLVMNAGINVFKYEATPDNIQVNHLSTSLLSLRMLPHLIKTGRETSFATPRLVIVSSDVHYWTSISKKEQEAPKILEKLSSKEYSTSSVMSQRYLVSKLLNLMFTRALNARISAATPIVVDTVNPGFCHSKLIRVTPFPMNIVGSLMQKALAFTSEEGSRQLVYGAVGGRGDEDQMRGAFIHFSKVTEASDFVISEEGGKVQDRLWAETVEILTAASPEVEGIIEEYLQRY